MHLHNHGNLLVSDVAAHLGERLAYVLLGYAVVSIDVELLEQGLQLLLGEEPLDANGRGQDLRVVY